MTLVWGSCDCFDFFWPLELRTRFVECWVWGSSLSASTTASMSLLAAMAPKNRLQKILKRYSGVDNAAGEECLRLRSEVTLLEECQMRVRVPFSVTVALEHFCLSTLLTSHCLPLLLLLRPPPALRRRVSVPCLWGPLIVREALSNHSNRPVCYHYFHITIHV